MAVNWCHLLMTFANSLYQDQARQNVGPDLDPNCFTLICKMFYTDAMYS